MEGEDAISYTDMNIEKAIDDFSNKFINEISLSKTITYTAKQLELVTVPRIMPLFCQHFIS